MQSSPEASEVVSLEELQEEVDTTALSAAGPRQILEHLEDMVLHPDYPCLGARSVFNTERATVEVLDELATAGATQVLLDRLPHFVEGTHLTEGFASFVAVFRGPVVESEDEFEQLLWRQLEQLHAADDLPWNDQVSADPDNPHFAFSVRGTAFFVVGMHPNASRIARRAPLPTLVFNLHEQFEELRASERYLRMRDTIRRRDSELQGSVNPMVRDHGVQSEARQYSGRAVPVDWEPPAALGPPARS